MNKAVLAPPPPPMPVALRRPHPKNQHGWGTSFEDLGKWPACFLAPHITPSMTLRGTRGPSAALAMRGDDKPSTVSSVDRGERWEATASETSEWECPLSLEEQHESPSGQAREQHARGSDGTCWQDEPTASYPFEALVLPGESVFSAVLSLGL